MTGGSLHVGFISAKIYFKDCENKTYYAKCHNISV
jgi:hypothetical protein